MFFNLEAAVEALLCIHLLNAMDSAPLHLPVALYVGVDKASFAQP